VEDQTRRKNNMISVTEAHKRFGDLARIRNGETIWIDVVTEEERWVPVYKMEGTGTTPWYLLGYEFEVNNV
jgi:hypothetical protein